MKKFFREGSKLIRYRVYFIKYKFGLIFIFAFILGVTVYLIENDNFVYLDFTGDEPQLRLVLYQFFLVPLFIVFVVLVYSDKAVLWILDQIIPSFYKEKIKEKIKKENQP